MVRLWFPLFTALCLLFHYFFFNDTATTEIYTLSLHDALPICPASPCGATGSRPRDARPAFPSRCHRQADVDRKSTRLNSSHLGISYAVFCLKKKNRTKIKPNRRSTSGAGEGMSSGQEVARPQR